MTDLTTPLAPRPQPYWLPPPPRRKRRTGLVIACAVAFAAAAVSGWLYIRADGDHDAAAAVLGARDRELAEVRGRIGPAQDARADAEARNADLESENAALTACVTAVQRYLWDGLEGDARSAAFDTMFTACH